MSSRDTEQTFNERLLGLVERLEAVADAYSSRPAEPKPDLRLITAKEGEGEGSGSGAT